MNKEEKKKDIAKDIIDKADDIDIDIKDDVELPKLTRQVHMQNFNIQVILSTEEPFEDMDYLVDKALNVVKSLSDADKVEDVA